MTLRLKMVLGIGTILGVVIVASSVIALMTLASHVRDVATREAELIAAVTERAIARAMTQGKSNEVQAILEEIGRLPCSTPTTVPWGSSRFVKAAASRPIV